MTAPTVALQHRIAGGEAEIGGTCIELTAGDVRVVLDVGFPLFDRMKRPLDGRNYQGAGTATLRQAGLLPDVAGLFVDDPRPAPDAVVITHPHQDHYGLIAHVKPGIPLYIGEAAARLIAVSALFLPHAAEPPQAFRTYRSGVPLTFGPLTLTPHLVDHSAFDAHAFLAEAGGRRLLYSGDFRRHGRKAATIDRLAAKARGVDTLLLEGTMLSRDDHAAPGARPSEAELEAALADELRNTDGLALVYASAQNIDRIVSIYRAAKRTGRTLVVDIYAATVLNVIAATSPRIPHSDDRRFGLRVVFPRSTTTRLFRQGHAQVAYAGVPHKLRWSELGHGAERYVLLARPSMREIARLRLGARPLVVYSQWAGYKKDPATKAFLNGLAARGARLVDLHVSGHAYPAALRDFAAKVDAGEVLPIHTLVPERYPELFGGSRATKG